MRNLFIVSLFVIMTFCFAACGNENAVDPTEETSKEVIEETSGTTVEETKAEVEPLTEKDFIVKFDNESEEIDELSLLDESEDDYSFQACYYDPEYDESKEGVIKTHRGVVLGDSKEVVEEKYGDGTSGDFDTDNDYCYEYSKNVSFDDDSGDTDVSAVMRAQCISYERYTFKDKYTISFYFDEDNEVSWIFFTKK